MRWAPRSTAATASARLPARRAPSSRPVMAPMVDLRDIPISTGRPQREQFGQPTHQCEIVRHSLAEAESGIDDDALAADAGRLTGADPSAQILLHLGHHIRIFAAVAAWSRAHPAYA